MKSEIDNTKLRLEQYPRLMLTPKGAILLMSSRVRGFVVHTTEESGWVVGEPVNMDYGSEISLFEGTLSLSN